MTPVLYHLCPRCLRAVPAAAGEAYCPNDGSKMLAACPRCQASLTSPYTRFCTRCGHDLRLQMVPDEEVARQRKLP